GCIWTHRGFVDPVREAGGEVAVFLPVLPLGRKWSANLRNHRKIVIADDNRALIGGMNLTKEYMGERTDPKRWIDTMAVVEGGVIKEMRRIFDEDWFFAGGTPLDLDIALNGYEEEGGSILQVVPSG